MRVTFDHQAFSLQNRGGITRYFYELIRYLSKTNGVEVQALLGFSSTIWPLHELLPQSGRLQHWGPRLVDSGMTTYAINEILLSLASLSSTKADLYHNTLYRFMPALRARSYVATHHDCIQERYPDLFEDRARIMRAKKKMFAQADLIFCVSESSRLDLEAFYGVAPSKCRVVYNGVSLMPRSPEGAQRFDQLTTRPFLLYVGTRAAYKNFDGFLKAFSALNLKAGFDIVAVGGDKFTEHEKGLAQILGLEPVLRIIPSASPAVLAEAYARAELLVYPSLYEGFGLPPLEAMLAGTPALIASCPATVEVCSGAGIFFDPQDPEHFCIQLTRALEDSELRKRSVEAGLALAQRFKWQTTAEQVMAGYESLR
jgi:glycosyltransferase involved in cell wall biosynthesis